MGQTPFYGYTSRKPASTKVPEAVKQEVTRKANELIETVLKPTRIPPPPENPQFNYIVDIYGKWYHHYFYICAKYRCPPQATVPEFEAKSVRMQYAGNQKFHLAFMRYTGQWIEPYAFLTIDECLEAIKDDPLFVF